MSSKCDRSSTGLIEHEVYLMLLLFIEREEWNLRTLQNKEVWENSQIKIISSFRAGMIKNICNISGQ